MENITFKLILVVVVFGFVLPVFGRLQGQSGTQKNFNRPVMPVEDFNLGAQKRQAITKNIDGHHAFAVKKVDMIEFAELPKHLQENPGLPLRSEKKRTRLGAHPQE